MQTTSQPRTFSASDVAALSLEKIAKLVNDQSSENAQLRHQLEWFKRQIFGQKSERRLAVSTESQSSLGEEFAAKPPQAAGKQTRVGEHVRVAKPKDESVNDESSLFFDESKVPVETIYLDPVTATGLNEDAFEIISEKVTYRLAQRPGSYVVTKYVRPVLKLRETGQLVSIPAPVGVIKGSRADVSFLAGVVVDKFAYHQPLYRIHRKLADQGFKLSRPWLTQLMQQTIDALIPIFEAQFDSIRRSRVKCMDETPIKAGVASPGKMKAAYFWPIYGELDEICFKFYPDRSAKNVEHALGLSPPDGAVLLTDGYAAYKQYAKKVGLTHAQCWAHTRRKFFDSQDIEPERAKQALDMIGELYVIEAQLREQALTGDAKKVIRQREAKPLVNKFFTWVQKQFDSQGLLPSSPLTKALAYAHERREGLEAYLNDPDVPIDTNHLERALRAIPMGRKNWLFCWTEAGAEHVGVVQSLITTCRLHDVDPYEYFVDVLQRVKNHPPLQMDELTPRRWKELFAQNPKRSVLHLIDQMRKKEE
jgi:transposase